MRLTAFRYGTTEITERMAFQDGREDEKIPVSLMFFLIEEGKRKILVDVGCDTMPGFELFEFEKPVNVLEKCGVMSEEITDVVITHSHHDHIAALYNYPKAAVYINEKELPQAEKYLPDKSKAVLFRKSKKLLSNVGILCVGGHSEGSSVVLIERKGSIYVLCGDECYTSENLAERKPTGSSCSLDKCKAFVEEYSKEKYTPILFHDPCVVEKIGFRVIFED